MKVILSVVWWRLFLACLMTVILSVPDEGYYERAQVRSE
jgi:hypothetical protein